MVGDVGVQQLRKRFAGKWRVTQLWCGTRVVSAALPTGNSSMFAKEDMSISLNVVAGGQRPSMEAETQRSRLRLPSFESMYSRPFKAHGSRHNARLSSQYLVRHE